MQFLILCFLTSSSLTRAVVVDSACDPATPEHKDPIVGAALLQSTRSVMKVDVAEDGGCNSVKNLTEKRVCQEVCPLLEEKCADVDEIRCTRCGNACRGKDDMIDCHVNCLMTNVTKCAPQALWDVEDTWANAAEDEKNTEEEGAFTQNGAKASTPKSDARLLPAVAWQPDWNYHWHPGLHGSAQRRGVGLCAGKIIPSGGKSYTIEKSVYPCQGRCRIFQYKCRYFAFNSRNGHCVLYEGGSGHKDTRHPDYSQYICYEMKKMAVPVPRQNCFPADAHVLVKRRGSVVPAQLRDVALGDLVAVGNPDTSNTWFAPLLIDLHADKEDKERANVLYLMITHEHGVMHISENHFVATVDDGFVPAHKVKMGAFFWYSKDNMLLKSRVLGIKTVLKTGMFAPLTWSGTILVDGVLASSYVVHHGWDRGDSLENFVSWLGGWDCLHRLTHFGMLPIRLGLATVPIDWLGSWFVPTASNTEAWAHPQIMNMGASLVGRFIHKFF